jgi:ABC-2 type transport system ATP-binding protein
MSHNNAIVIENLKKSYKNLEVLKGINLSVEKGTMLALLGPNGAGKTTIVRILSTLLNYDEGSVFVNGFDLDKDAFKVRQSIGLTSQYAAVDEFLTGKENLDMMGRLYHLSSHDASRRTTELLEQFDLVEASTRPVKSYSGGMRRRLDLAVSLIATPPILFLDEPTTGLDPRSRIAMWDVIKKLMEKDVTILLTTQYLEEADQLANKIAVIDGGKVIAEGTSDELKKNVGAERLELVVEDESKLAMMEQIFPGRNIQLLSKQKTVSIAVEQGVSEIRDILSKLENNSIAVETLSLHKPTLDDVFIQLTGHQAEVGTEKDESEKENK